MKWVIGILDSDTANKIVYVTSVDFNNQTYKVEPGKDAVIFDNRKPALQCVEGIIAHLRRAVLIDARHFYDQFKNDADVEIEF